MIKFFFMVNRFYTFTPISIIFTGSVHLSFSTLDWEQTKRIKEKYVIRGQERYVEGYF